jgi:hypothetical protein
MSTPNTYHIEVAMRIPPDTEPPTEKPSKMEIPFSQCTEENVTTKSTDADLCQFIVCTLLHNEENAMIRYIYIGNPSVKQQWLRPKYIGWR